MGSLLVGRAEILAEMGERAHHRVRRKAAQRAQRSEFHGVAEVFEQRDVLAPPFALDDAVDDLDPSCRANAARRALAAGLQRAELHGEASLLHHVDGVVENHNAPMADEAALGRERLVIEGRVEQRRGGNRRQAGRRSERRGPDAR